MRKTLRELGHRVGNGETGRLNHILDVPGGLGLAHRTYRDDAKGVCTGFTVLQPSAEVNLRRAAAVHALNGAGELTCTHQIREWGFLDTPIALTGTMSVGRAYEGISNWMMDQLPELGNEVSVIIPVVGECDDSALHDVRATPWGPKDMTAALDEARAMCRRRADDPVAPAALAQGGVGGGTGMISFGFKSGIGSSSRVVTVEGKRYTVGVLLQSNFGERWQLTVLGRAVGRESKAPEPKSRREGSCIAVLATDAPLCPLGLQRIATRLGLGLARAGSHAGHGSGEIFLAFSTAAQPVFRRDWNSEQWNPLLYAAVEAAEEAVYNSLALAEPVENSRMNVAAIGEAIGLAPRYCERPLRTK